MRSSNASLELMRRCLDGEASEEEFARLEELLRNDAEFRTDYLRYANIDSALSALPKSLNGAADDVEQESSQPLAELEWIKSHGPGVWLAVCIALLLFVGIPAYQAITWGIGGNQGDLAQQGLIELENTNDTGVAVLTRVAGLTGTATSDWRIGQTIPPGSMTWDSGLLQLEFYGGATVVAEGPAEIEILDESRVVCRRGRLRAHVPEPARGFAVLAPSFELVDVGTEFGLDVSQDGVSEVHVFDGKVELYEAKSNRSLATRRELIAGDALTVDRDGASIQTDAREADFVTPNRLSKMTDVKRQEQLLDWRALRDSLQEDQRVVAYFSFDRNSAADRLLIGIGRDDTTIEGAIVGCEWSEGRWPSKRSLQFKRPGSHQYPK